MSKVSSGSLRLSGNAFQTDGLATEKARQPNVVPWNDQFLLFSVVQCLSYDREVSHNLPERANNRQLSSKGLVTVILISPYSVLS